ncbi:MAG: MBOAT family protein [Candidatus Hydrogenedentes bacterium]|nr:MBOAT family protein [Candidatus Hydrogenedentota bacterium]
MLFNSWTFAAFIVIVLPIYYSLSRRGQNLFLLVASYVFYGWWDWRFLGLLWVSTVVDYAVALSLDKTTSPGRRRGLISISLFTNLGMLGFFKYFDFFVTSAIDALSTLGIPASPPLLEVVLPVGISFYSFQTLSYALDVYRRDQPACRSFVDFALFVAYLPQLVAGPIERATRLLPQIQADRRVGQREWATGLQLILWGYVKKVAIADSLARYADAAFTNPAGCDALTLLLCVYAFAIQIYCDFSGYSDIARGISRLMGIELMENFRQPYLSRNITEFWRRWHISLSTWLRDYLYIPLGGNRGGPFAQYKNIMITMLLGGLWHGANWTFVIWGGLHGIFLAVHKFYLRKRKVSFEPVPIGVGPWLNYAAGVFVTFHLVCLTWVFFRAPDLDSALAYNALLINNSAAVSSALATPDFLGLWEALFFYGLVIFALDFRCWRRASELPFTEEDAWWRRGIAYAAGMLILMLVRENSSGAFIYFQF